MNERTAFAFFSASINSKGQDATAEHRFLEMLLVQAAASGQKINVHRGNFDAFGFALLLCLGSVTRLVQLYARSGGVANDGYWDVHSSLLGNPDGRIICARLQLVAPTPEGVADRIHYGFKLFDYQAHTAAACRRSPLKAHTGKCKILGRKFTSFTTNLLVLFT